MLNYDYIKKRNNAWFVERINHYNLYNYILYVYLDSDYDVIFNIFDEHYKVSDDFKKKNKILNKIKITKKNYNSIKNYNFSFLDEYYNKAEILCKNNEIEKRKEKLVKDFI